MRFRDTRLEREETRVRLLDAAGRVLLELKGHEIDDAIRAGFVDPNNWHYSVFEYAEMRRTLKPITAAHQARSDSFDSDLLSRFNIRWD